MSSKKITKSEVVEVKLNGKMVRGDVIAKDSKEVWVMDIYTGDYVSIPVSLIESGARK